MAEKRIFVGRKDELEKFGKVLEKVEGWIEELED